MNAVAGDGIVAAAIGDAARRRERVEAERARLERLVAKHKASLQSLPYEGTGRILETIGPGLCQDIGRRRGVTLRHRVSGPFGMSPDWYLSIDETDGSNWSILRFVGGPERIRIAVERRGPGIPMPDDLSELAALFERAHDEDAATGKGSE